MIPDSGNRFSDRIMRKVKSIFADSGDTERTYALLPISPQSLFQKDR